MFNVVQDKQLLMWFPLFSDHKENAFIEVVTVIFYRISQFFSLGETEGYL